MDLKELRAFLMLAEELHYRRAAEKLHISQPPLTKTIQQLEAKLGVVLFDRNRRNVQLTAAGVTLVTEARRLLTQLELSKRSVQQAEHGESGRLRIGFVSAVLFMDIQKVVASITTEFPTLELVWEEMGSSEQIEALVHDRIDLGFAQLSQSIGALHTLVIGHAPMVVALPVSHPFAAQKQIDLKALSDDRFITIPRQSAPKFHDLTVSACMDAGFSPNIMHYAKHLISIVSLVAMGCGVALVPSSFVRSAIPGVVYSEIKNAVVQAEYAVVWNPKNGATVLEKVVAHISKFQIA